MLNDEEVRVCRFSAQCREAVEEAVNSLMVSTDSFAVQMSLAS